MDAAPSPVVGSLADMPGADLLRALARTETSGMLKVGEINPTWVALASGAVVIAGIAGGRTLADELRAEGIVEGAVIDDAEAHGAHHDLVLLSGLVRDGADDALVDAVRRHTVAAVFQLLLPSTERFAFQPGAAISVARHISFSVEAILGDAQERLREWAAIAATVPSTQTVFLPRRHLDPGTDDVTVRREDWPVLAVLDGRRSVAQVLAATGRSSFEVLSSLHRLAQAALIEARSGQGSVGRPDR